MWHAVAPVERERIASLFRGVPRLRAVIDSVLEGNLGTAEADALGSPRAACLEMGCYSIFGGDASVPSVRDRAAAIPAPRELLFPDSDDWRRLLRDVHGERLSDRSMQAFATDGLDVERLRGMATVPDGLELRRIDEALASRLDDSARPHALQVFENAKDFADRGVGFAAVAGGRPVCAATSYAFSRDAIELAIATHPDFRGRGLAYGVAAALMVHCLERGVTPHWNAANPVSQRLAERLGYRPEGICEVLFFE